jgi:hypothetical protein
MADSTSKSVIDLDGPGPFDLGTSHQCHVSVSQDKKYIQFQFDFLIQREGKSEEISIQLVHTTERAMGLLLTLQEIQRIERFPLPSVPILTTINRNGS